MKKVILLCTVLLGIVAISSCKKDRICECTVESTGFLTLTLTVDTTFTDISKGDAETKCSALNSSVEDPEFGLNVETTCELE